MTLWNSLWQRPRHLTALCGCGATGLGLAYMTAGGAPFAYLVMNASALLLGLLAIGIIAQVERPDPLAPGALNLALAGALLLASLFGASADGITRWVAAGGVMLQPSLILLPILALRFARSRDGLSTFAITIAAFALALQPDRAMAGALAAAMAAVALLRPGRNTLLASGAALAGLAAAMLRPDPSRAMPFVDQIFYSSFAVHPLAGMAVLAGAVLMLVPALVGWRVDPDNREAYAAFGLFWLAVIAAAALGNYPTPLVGYSGSAIIGYMLAVAGLPRRRQAASADGAAPGRGEQSSAASRGPFLLGLMTAVRFSRLGTEMARSSCASR